MHGKQLSWKGKYHSTAELLFDCFRKVLWHCLAMGMERKVDSSCWANIFLFSIRPRILSIMVGQEDQSYDPHCFTTSLYKPKDSRTLILELNLINQKIVSGTFLCLDRERTPNNLEIKIFISPENLDKVFVAKWKWGAVKNEPGSIRLSFTFTSV